MPVSDTIFDNCVRLGMCLSACFSKNIELPASTKVLERIYRKNLRLVEINEEQVLTAIRDMCALVDAVEGEGYLERMIRLGESE